MRKLILKGKEILQLSSHENMHQFSIAAKLSYQTVFRYLGHPEKQSSFDGETLVKILVDGTGLTPEQVLAKPMSAFFEYLDESEKK